MKGECGGEREKNLEVGCSVLVGTGESKMNRGCLVLPDSQFCKFSIFLSSLWLALFLY